MIFSFEGKEIELKGMQGKPPKVIRSNNVTKLLKKVHPSVIAQLCSLVVQTFKHFVPLDPQRVIDNHSKVFAEMPKGLPPARENNHAVPLILDNLSHNI
jgi:hypothetical protein